MQEQDARTFRSLFGYDDWANWEVSASLKNAPETGQRAVGLFAHVLAVEWLWLSRIRGRKAPAPVWPDWTQDQCVGQAGSLREAWEEFFRGLKPEELSRTVSYTNSRGEPWTNRVGDILFQVVFHSAYHRGQIASDLRASGARPPETDYILAVRSGFLEGCFGE